MLYRIFLRINAYNGYSDYEFASAILIITIMNALQLFWLCSYIAI